MSDLRVPGGWDGAIDSGLGPSKSAQASRRPGGPLRLSLNDKIRYDRYGQVGLDKGQKG